MDVDFMVYSLNSHIMAVETIHHAYLEKLSLKYPGKEGRLTSLNRPLGQGGVQIDS